VSSYLYRSELVARVRRLLAEGAVVLWGPPGLGKTLLLKEVARAEGLAYRTRPGEGPAAYDLEVPPFSFVPGAVYALPFRPEGGGASLLGPERFAFPRPRPKSSPGASARPPSPGRGFGGSGVGPLSCARGLRPGWWTRQRSR